MNSISLALIDNHPITIEGLTYALRSQGDFEVLENGATSRDALSIAERCRPELMILELSIPGNAIATISEIAAKYPKIKIIAFTGAPGIDYAVSAIEAGARGYVSKTCTTSELIHAVREVIAGDTYISQNFASGVITALRNASVRKIAAQALKLSRREDQIIHLLLGGRTNKEIAIGLGITERTVKHYMTVLMQKPNARNRVEVVIAAQNLQRAPSSPQGLEASRLSLNN